MTTLLEALRRLRDLEPETPRAPTFIAHPAWTEDDETLAVLRGMQANGVDVQVMPSLHSPAIPLESWRPSGTVTINCMWGEYDLHGRWQHNPLLPMTADEQRADNRARGWPCP